MVADQQRKRKVAAQRQLHQQASSRDLTLPATLQVNVSRDNNHKDSQNGTKITDSRGSKNANGTVASIKQANIVTSIITREGWLYFLEAGASEGLPERPFQKRWFVLQQNTRDVLPGVLLSYFNSSEDAHDSNLSCGDLNCLGNMYNTYRPNLSTRMHTHTHTPTHTH
jgi:hypothetical protein